MPIRRAKRAARGLARGFSTLNTIRKGRKADKLRKRVVNTRTSKRLSASTQARISHKTAVRRAKRFLK